MRSPMTGQKGFRLARGTPCWVQSSPVGVMWSLALELQFGPGGYHGTWVGLSNRTKMWLLYTAAGQTRYKPG